MNLSVPYRKSDHLDLTLPGERLAAIVAPNAVEVGDQDETLRAALAEPLGSPSFADFMADARDVVIIVNDATRPTPTARVLDYLEPDLPVDRVSFLVATGVHRAPTPTEYEQIFGRHYARFADVIFAHDARADEMVFLGRSSNGTDMHVNRRAVEAHKIVIIGSVEPHYFAGYTGGRKSFLPGVASFETIEQNHKLALQPGARALALEGNPVHEDMVDALGTVEMEVFSIQTVLDRHHRIYAATAGDILASFDAAVAAAKEVFAVPVGARAEVVVSVVKFPQDIDLYQAQKGLENGKLALADGGILILVAECRDGIGGKTFAKLLGSADTPGGVMKTIEGGYHLGYHKAGKMAEIAQRAQMWGVTGLPDEDLAPLFIKPCGDLQTALDDALAQQGPDAKALLLLDAGLVVPLLP